MPAESGDDAVAVALVLDLEHDALVGLVRAVGGFGDDAVEAGAFEAVKPVRGDGAVLVAGVRWRGGGGFAATIRVCAARCERQSEEVFRRVAEEIEEDDGGGSLFGEKLDARCGGMDAELQGVEVEAAVVAMTISPSSTQCCRKLIADGIEHLGEVAVEGLVVAAL